MPLLGEVSYLASWWQDAGLVQQGAMGAVPISASELRAWADGRLIHLAAWEFQTMLDLSREFVAYGRKAPEEPAPYRHDGQDGREPEPDRDAVSRKVASILSARSKTKR